MPDLAPVEEFDLTIFGGTGDLAMRKLLPALYHRNRDKQFVGTSRVIAVGRRNLTRDAYLELAENALRRNLTEENFSNHDWDAFRQRVHYLAVDVFNPQTWGNLTEMLSGYSDRIRVAYMATAPGLFGSIAKGLAANGLITPLTRIVLEKPLGHDHGSACILNNEVGECFYERQIYRIDHYLGKETVQNLLALRFANSLFEPLWRRGAVDHVQITVAEDLGVGNRVDFYNQIGALRDMVQNHLLQLVCLVAMETPSSLHHDSVRDEKMKVLRALKPICTDQIKTRTVRGQYTAGAISGHPVPGYIEELEQRDSLTETFVALKIEIDNWRWSGVPFYLRTGKRLKGKHSQIVVQFQKVPHSIFPEQQHDVTPNRLSIQLQPDEGVKLSLMAKEPGPGGFELRPVSLDLSFEEAFGVGYPDAYERLLIEALRGNPALFVRRDEVELAWRWIDRIRQGWDDAKQRVEPYIAGSWGPSVSASLLDRDGRSWYLDGLGVYGTSVSNAQ